MKIVALDPGGTTGVCVLRLKKDTTLHYNLIPKHPAISTAQLTGDHHKELWKLLATEAPDVVVCESFTYQRRDKVVLVSVEYIGIAKLYCSLNKTPLAMQAPSQAKNLWTDEKLKRADLWEPGKVHAMDAVRHAMYYVTVALKDLTWISRTRTD